jgi:hypothetical protein
MHIEPRTDTPRITTHVAAQVKRTDGRAPRRRDAIQPANGLLAVMDASCGGSSTGWFHLQFFVNRLVYAFGRQHEVNATTVSHRIYYLNLATFPS